MISAESGAVDAQELDPEQLPGDADKDTWGLELANWAHSGAKPTPQPHCQRAALKGGSKGLGRPSASVNGRELWNRSKEWIKKYKINNKVFVADIRTNIWVNSSYGE